VFASRGFTLCIAIIHNKNKYLFIAFFSLLIIEKKYYELIHSVCVIISFFFNTCFFRKKEEKKSAMKKENAREREREINTTKEDFMILMYVTMRVVRLCNTEDR